MDSADIVRVLLVDDEDDYLITAEMLADQDRVQFEVDWCADYAVLVKQELDRAELERSIRYAISHQKAERYALAVRAASDGIWDWDLDSDRVYLSGRWHAILGLPEEPRHDRPSAWFDLVAPDDLPRLRGAITAHLEGRDPHLEC